MKKLASIILLLFCIFPVSIYAWGGQTHEAISSQIEGEKQTFILDIYLKNLGYSDGKNTKFIYAPVTYGGPIDEDRGIYARWETAWKWFLEGSVKEDGHLIGPFPDTRARHHYHDPTTGSGLGSVVVM